MRDGNRRVPVKSIRIVPLDASKHPTESPAPRIREALAALLGEREFDEITVGDLLQRADVGKDEFDACYPDLDFVLADLWNQYKQEFITETLPAISGQSDWLEAIRVGAWAAYEYMQRDRTRCKVLVYKLEKGGEVLRAERDHSMDIYIEVVHAGRFQTADPEAFSRDIAVGLTSSIWERINERVRADDFDQVANDIPEMIYMTVLPYLGAEVAEVELRRGREELRRGKRP